MRTVTVDLALLTLALSPDTDIVRLTATGPMFTICGTTSQGQYLNMLNIVLENVLAISFCQIWRSQIRIQLYTRGLIITTIGMYYAG